MNEMNLKHGKKNPDYKKLLRILYVAFFCFLLGANFMRGEPSYAQRTLLTLSFNNVTLETVFNSIRQQSEFEFFYNNDQVDTSIKVNVNVKDADIYEVLKQILPATYNYAINDRYVLISKTKAQASSATVLNMQQQGRTITGIVRDASGPVIGANVVVKGTTNGAVTNINGQFSIPNVPSNAVLQVSFIGYISQEVSAGNQTSMEITIIEDVGTLEEVVVIGYGTQRKETLTGSVVALKGSEIVKSPIVNLTSSLAGRLPGVIINTRSAEPGRDVIELLIRGRSTTGNSSALVIIDGVERSGMGQLNPNDIENISVLKDAEAAVYGSRAANGVILITTKRGETGKPIVNFSYNQGYSQPTRVMKMADAYTYAQVYNEFEIGEGRPPRYTDAELQKFKDGSDPDYPNTDWNKFIIKNLTPQNRANLSVSGGNEKAKYYLSIGEVNQKGQYKFGSINYQQINIRSNVDVQVNDYLKVGMNLMGRYEDKHYPYDSISYVETKNWNNLPIWQPYWPGTDYLMPLRDSENIINIVNDSRGTDDHLIRTIESSLFFKLDLPWIDGLSIDGSGSYDFTSAFRKVFNTPSYVYYKNTQTGELYKGLAGSSTALSSLNERADYRSLFYLSAKINYQRKFGDHNVNAMLGYEQTQIKSNFLQAGRSDFLSASIPQIFAGSTDKNKQSNNGSASQDSKQNYFGRIIYDYSGKYMMTVAMRIDGSPRFAKGNRFGYFPSVSAGWRISEESFMKEMDWIQNLKIRGSYGIMGNDLVSPFQYLTSYQYGNNYVIGNGDVSGLVQSGVPNPKITWETAKTWNLGVDATISRGLLGIEFDVFKTRRSDILTRRTVIVPEYTGLSLPDENIGIVDNKGFELVLSHNNQINDFKYSLSGNVSFARNNVVFADEAPAAEPYQMATGRPYGAALYYKAIGIYKDKDEVNSTPHLTGAVPGDIIYADLNGDNIIDSRDRYRENKTRFPEIVFGLTANFAYKGFDMSLFFQGQENAVQYHGGTYVGVLSHTQGNFPMWRAIDHWTPEHTTASQPRANRADNNTNYNSSHWLFDTGFLRLKNVELGYSLPKNICQKLSVQNLRIYLSGSNLFFIYDHCKDFGVDPEITGIFSYYPQRVYNFGVNFSF